MERRLVVLPHKWADQKSPAPACPRHAPAMRRRAFLALLGGSAMAVPWAAGAQQPPPRKVAVLVSNPDFGPELRKAFIPALASRGWIEGRTVSITLWASDGTAKQAAIYAQEIVRGSPDVIYTVNSISTAAAQHATRTIPVIFSSVSDAVGAGFVESLSHPGGNVTGFTNYEYGMGRKWLELLKQVYPPVDVVGVVFNPDNPGGRGHLATIEEAAPEFGLRVMRIGTVRKPALSEAFENLRAQPGPAVLVTPSGGIAENYCAELALRLHLVGIYARRETAVSAGLLSYGIDRLDQLRHAADYVDRILRGASPRDLPVQAPETFRLVINLQTAKALGITAPASLLARADEVIE